MNLSETISNKMNVDDLRCFEVVPSFHELHDFYQRLAVIKLSNKCSMFRPVFVGGPGA